MPTTSGVLPYQFPFFNRQAIIEYLNHLIGEQMNGATSEPKRLSAIKKFLFSQLTNFQNFYGKKIFFTADRVINELLYFFLVKKLRNFFVINRFRGELLF
jgi:hypothetical protein